MKEMGANTLRLYAFKTSVRHTKFLDHAMALDLTVFAAFELGSCSMRRVSPLYLPYISTLSPDISAIPCGHCCPPGAPSV